MFFWSRRTLGASCWAQNTSRIQRIKKFTPHCTLLSIVYRPGLLQDRAPCRAPRAGLTGTYRGRGCQDPGDEPRHRGRHPARAWAPSKPRAFHWHVPGRPTHVAHNRVCAARVAGQPSPRRRCRGQHHTGAPPDHYLPGIKRLSFLFFSFLLGLLVGLYRVSALLCVIVFAKHGCLLCVGVCARPHGG